MRQETRDAFNARASMEDNSKIKWINWDKKVTYLAQELLRGLRLERVERVEGGAAMTFCFLAPRALAWAGVPVGFFFAGVALKRK